MPAEYPAATVLMPTQARNLDYLEQALRSIYAQTMPDFELLLLFDGVPRERAAEILATFPDPRLRPIISERQRGLPRMLNLGARLARAPFLARMDDDDRSLPTRLARQLEVMQKGDVDVLGTWTWIIDENGRRLSDSPLRPNPTTPFTPIRAIFGSIFAHPSVVMRKDWLLKHKFDPAWRRGQDRELWVRAERRSQYRVIKEPLLEYRQFNLLKPNQLANVINAYRLIWRNRRRFGKWVPILFSLNLLRHGIYWFRIKFGR